MNETRSFGRHIITFIPPDLVFLRFDGDVSESEAQAMSIFFSGKIQNMNSRFVVDIGDLGAIGPGARKEFAAQRYAPTDDNIYGSDLAFIRSSLRTKVLMTVIVAAARMTSAAKVRSHFFASAHEAAAWAGVPVDSFGG